VTRPLVAAALLAVAALAASAFAQQSGRAPGEALAERTIASSFTSVAPEWRARFEQDDTQKLCTQHRNEPPREVADRLKATARATIQYPTDGKLLGDWKKGEELAQSGYGLRFTDRDTQRPNGGNCYACHEITKAEVSFGTLGPSLSEYGKIRKFAEADTRALYDKIYNSQATFPCSNMPRFGAHKFLTIEQIKDLVALLMDPNSPVNK
jgi:L-cysteine S-thiosulfotransferase